MQLFCFASVAFPSFRFSAIIIFWSTTLDKKCFFLPHLHFNESIHCFIIPLLENLVNILKPNIVTSTSEGKRQENVVKWRLAMPLEINGWGKVWTTPSHVIDSTHLAFVNYKQGLPLHTSGIHIPGWRAKSPRIKPLMIHWQLGSIWPFCSHEVGMT